MAVNTINLTDSVSSAGGNVSAAETNSTFMAWEKLFLGHAAYVAAAKSHDSAYSRARNYSMYWGAVQNQQVPGSPLWKVAESYRVAMLYAAENEHKKAVSRARAIMRDSTGVVVGAAAIILTLLTGGFGLFGAGAAAPASGTAAAGAGTGAGAGVATGAVGAIGAAGVTAGVAAATKEKKDLPEMFPDIPEGAGFDEGFLPGGIPATPAAGSLPGAKKIGTGLWSSVGKLIGDLGKTGAGVAIALGGSKGDNPSAAQAGIPSWLLLAAVALAVLILVLL